MRVYRVYNTNYIRKNKAVSDYIVKYVIDEDVASKFIKGIANADKITTETDFDFYDGFVGNDNKSYMVLENKLGLFITREDNVEIVMDDQAYLEDFYNIKSIIKAGDKTILVTVDGRTITTTRDKTDKYDIEKAVMMLLLKKDGYKVEDIYTIINSAVDSNKSKKSTKSKGVKTSTKKIKDESVNVAPETV